jgi:hypothetical protein
LAVSPGSTYSTTEVYRGLVDGLVAQGHEVLAYDLYGHFLLAIEEVRRTYRRAGLADLVPNKRERKGAAQDFYKAAIEVACRDIFWIIPSQAVDWVLFVSPLLVVTGVLSALSGLMVKRCLVFTESPYDDVRQLHKATHSELATLNDYSSAALAGLPYLPMGYCEGLHVPRHSEPEVPVHDVVFVGVGYPERIALLEAVDWSGINLGLYGDWRVGRKSPLRPFIHQGVLPNSEATQLYRNSLVGLNLHRTTTDYWGKGGEHAWSGVSLNPRAYELAACGVPQLSDWRDELEEVFGRELAGRMSIDGPEALGYSIRRLLASPECRKELASEQQGAVLGKHSYHQRAARLAELMLSAGG